jgi:hypothetical protein
MISYINVISTLEEGNETMGERTVTKAVGDTANVDLNAKTKEVVIRVEEGKIAAQYVIKPDKDQKEGQVSGAEIVAVIASDKNDKPIRVDFDLNKRIRLEGVMSNSEIRPDSLKYALNRAKDNDRPEGLTVNESLLDQSSKAIKARADEGIKERPAVSSEVVPPLPKIPMAPAPESSSASPSVPAAVGVRNR